MASLFVFTIQSVLTATVESLSRESHYSTANMCLILKCGYTFSCTCWKDPGTMLRYVMFFNKREFCKGKSLIPLTEDDIPGFDTLGRKCPECMDEE